MKRNIINFFTNWKNSAYRKPLIVRGARQVGKTYTITEFGKNCFNNLVKIDFEKQSRLKKIFDGDFNIKNIIEMIELELQTEIIAGKTLLFFDEIQLCPRALSALRYFFEDMPELHVIAAGSLLKFEMDKISFPVGRVEFKFMYPMTFEEFLINTGNEKLFLKRPELFKSKKSASFVSLKLFEELKKYFVVGGMPEAVKFYLSNSINSVSKIHENLFNSFIQDILKYEKNIDIDILQNLIEAIPRHTSQNIKYTNLCKGVSVYKIKMALKVLEKSLLVHVSRSSSASGLPLSSGINKSAIKLFFLDIGFMQHICGIKIADLLNSADLLQTYRGKLCEQFIAQELIAAGGSQNQKLFFWSRAKKNSNAEIDFLIVRNGKIYPLEIKNGPAGKLKSLHLFLKEHSDIKEGYVMNTGESGKVDKINFRPLFAKIPHF